MIICYLYIFTCFLLPENSLTFKLDFYSSISFAIFATLWTVAYQASQSIGFSRQEYWSGLPLPSPGDLPDPGIEPGSPASQADSLPAELSGKPKSSSQIPTRGSVCRISAGLTAAEHQARPCLLEVLKAMRTDATASAELWRHPLRSHRAVLFTDWEKHQ